MAAANAADCKTLHQILLLPVPLQEIGTGATARVYRKGDYVLKKISTRTPEARRDARAEIQTLKDLQAVPALRKYLPHFCGSYSERGVSWIIQKYKPVVTLHTLLETHRAAGTRIPFEFSRALATHLVQGLEALHRAGFLHRDLKPENILIRQGLAPGHMLEAVPLFIDFGLACRLPCRESRRVGTFEFVPQNWWHPAVRQPVLTRKGKPIQTQKGRLSPHYSKGTDSYALAKVLEELLEQTDTAEHANSANRLRANITRRRGKQTAALAAQIAVAKGLAPPPESPEPLLLPSALPPMPMAAAPPPPPPRGRAAAAAAPPASPWTMESILKLVRWKPPSRSGPLL